MPHGAERDIAIESATSLELELDRLEDLTDLSHEEIMAEYEKLDHKQAQYGIDLVLEELDLFLEKEEMKRLQEKVRTGNFKAILPLIKKFMPNRLVLATACTLALTIATWNNPGEVHATTTQPSTSIERTLNADVMQKAHSITQEANVNAKNVINNASGFVKALAQKEIVDTVADHSADIIAFLKGESTVLPQLNGDAAKLLDVYKDMITKIDQLNDKSASEEARNNLIKKIQIVGTKNYDVIKKELA